MENAIVRVPELARGRGRCSSINGPEAFTPDGEFILGPTDVRGFWVAAGFCAHGLAGAGGMGKLVAEWIVEGIPSLDVWEMDSRRFGAALREPRLHARAHASRSTRPTTTSSTRATSGRPGGRCGSRRPTRGCGELGAAFGEKSGWERANWFEPNAARGRRVAAPARLGRAALVARDRRRAPRLPRDGRALRRDVASPRSRSRARARPTFLERLCANRVARDVGAITYTSMLNARGGIECDFTVTRLAEDRFRIVTGTAFGQHDLAWIRAARARRRLGRASRTSPRRYACLGLWGPARARDPPAADDRRPRRSRTCARASSPSAPVPCLALRVTYVGELGWELYCPIEFGLRALGRALGGGPRARPRRRRLQGDRLAAAREGLPRLGRRHHARRHALRGRARLRGQARQGRLHRARGAARGAGAGAPPRLPRARRSARGRARLGAGAHRRRARRPRHERRLRLHGRALDRLRLRPGRDAPSPGSRSRWRSSASGSRARSPPSRSSILPESGSGAEPFVTERPGPARARRPRRTPLDPLELLLGALADRALEPLLGREHVPAAEEQERPADHDRRVVDEVPVEARRSTGRRLVANGSMNTMQMNDDPEDRDPVDPLVVPAEVPRAALELLACLSRRMIGSMNAM